MIQIYPLSVNQDLCVMHFEVLFIYKNIVHINSFEKKIYQTIENHTKNKKCKLFLHSYSCIIHLDDIILSELVIEIHLMASIINNNMRLMRYTTIQD